MKPLIGYTDPFLSPVTGKLTGMQQLPDLTFGHVWMGDKLNRPIETYKLIDLAIDVKTLQDQVAHPTLEYQHVWVGNRFHKAEPARYLPLENLPVLGAALFPYPSSIALPAIPIPNPTFNPTSGFDWLMSGPWLPQIYAGSTNTLNTQSNTSISSSLAMTQINVAQAIKRFFHAKLIVKTKAIDFTWDNPAMSLIPQTIKDLYGLNTHYDLTNATALDELGSGLLWNAANGELQSATLTYNHVWVGDVNNRPVESAFAPLPNLTTGMVWRGDANNRPQEVLLDIPSSSQEYILQNKPANSGLPNAIGLNNLFTFLDANGSDKLLKIKKHGLLNWTAELMEAEANTDYTTPNYVTNLVNAVQAELEGQILSLTGYATMALLIQAIIDAGLIVGGAAYGQIIRGQTLNVGNTWYAADSNDEAHNAVGNFKIRYPTGYSSDDRGHGTIWFDSKGRNLSNSISTAEGGVRVFSWDSAGDSLLPGNSPLAPVHIGIFGYQNKYAISPLPNPTPRYNGFIFRSEFNDEHDSDNYRFPVNFGLYQVQRTISKSQYYNWGWEMIDPIFVYDLTQLTFYKNIDLGTKSITASNPTFHGEAMIIPSGTQADRPAVPAVGMLRLCSVAG